MTERLIINVIDNLESTSPVDALSANMGRHLKALIDNIKSENIMTANTTVKQDIALDNTYEPLDLNHSVSVGNKLTLKNKGIVIGDGVTKVKISGKVVLNSVKIGGKYARITNNGLGVDILSINVDNTGTALLVFPTKLINVKGGDVLGMEVYGAKGDRVQPELARSFLTVEVVE